MEVSQGGIRDKRNGFHAAVAYVAGSDDAGRRRMIRYDLTCSQGCRFDGWFRDSAGFEAEREARRLVCPLCGGSEVDRALMAPAVSGRSAREPAEGPPAPGATREHPMAQAVRTLRRKLETHADYVGGRFADEARAMHRGEAESRPIWGEATLTDAKALVEEGAPIAPLPPLPRRDD